MTPGQYDAIHHALPSPAARLPVETAIESGLRWGELTEFRPSDQPRSRMLTVTRAVTETTTTTTTTFNTNGSRFGVKASPKDKECG